MSLGLLPEGESIYSKETTEQKNMRFNTLHHQLLASAKAVALGHAINPNFKIGCMIAGAVIYPFSY